MTKQTLPSPKALSAQTVRGFKAHHRRVVSKGKDRLRQLADNIHFTIRDMNHVALDIEADAIEAMLPAGLVRFTWTINENFNQDPNEDIESLDAEFDINGAVVQVSLLSQSELTESLRNEEESVVLELAGTPEASASDRKTITRAVQAFGLKPDDYEFLRRFVSRGYRVMQEDSWEF